MHSWIPILVQAGLAALALHVLRWHVLPSLPRSQGPTVEGAGGAQRELILDVWAPVAIVLPLLFTVSWIGHSVRGVGWPALGGPVYCGVLALAFACFVRTGHASDRPEALTWPPRLAGGMAIIAGVILLLLGAAHTMHILVGQVAFALVAVLLWVNTPDLPQDRGDVDEQSGAWLGMAAVVLCALGMGVASLFVVSSLQPLSALVLLLHGTVALALVAKYTGAAACLRVGIWAGALGTLGALGGLSIGHMFLQAIQFVLGDVPAPVQVVAFGFGAYALEATILLVLPLVMLISGRLVQRQRLVAGIAMLAAAIVLAIWRLNGI